MTIKLDNDKVSKIRMDLKLAEILSTTSKLPDYHCPTNLKLPKACIIIIICVFKTSQCIINFTISLIFLGLVRISGFSCYTNDSLKITIANLCLLLTLCLPQA